MARIARISCRWLRVLCVLTVLQIGVALSSAGGGTGMLPMQIPIGPTLGIYGGWAKDYMTAPFMMSWNTRINCFGGGWKPQSHIKLHIRGPLNSLTLPPTDHILGTLFTDADGSISGSVENTGSYVMIPYDGGVTGNLGTNLPNILPPGHYEVYGVLDDPSQAQMASASSGMELIPATFTEWGVSRGMRRGFLGDTSPEFLDPEWVTVWSKAPVQMYGTIAATNDIFNNQPMLISHHEAPGSHYAHDANLMVLPDPAYRWVLGTANIRGEEDDKEFGRIELEWELQNNYSPLRMQQGVVGMPLWVHGSLGDRIYTVGAWVMDGGHRDEGFRTEIHPPRLLAVMRKYPATVPLSATDPSLIPAKQVDIFVSGHGGGINQYYDGLEDLLDRNGQGGGRLEDFMATEIGNRPVWDTYFRYGPGDGALLSIITAFLDNVVTEATVYPIAGPSAVGTDVNTGLPAIWDHSAPPPSNIRPWVLGPEERPINDMDYDFEVRLPAPPSDKVLPRVTIETHSEHTTSVNEVITYGDPDPRTDLPRKAFIHLPYKGADNGVYARTLKFSWTRYSWPGRHLRVKIDEVTFFLPEFDTVPPYSWPWNQFNGKEVMWVNVCGQWISLTDLAPDKFLSGALNRKVSLGDAAPVFDVYVQPDDEVLVYSYGYDRCSMEHKYVGDIGKSAYQQAASIIDAMLGSGDNKKLGAALYSRLASPLLSPEGIVGQHFVGAGYTKNTDHFYEENYSAGYTLGFTVSIVPNPRANVSPTAVDFGGVVLGSTAEKKIKVSNLAKGFGNMTVDTLHLTPSASGTGYTVTPAEPFGVGTEQAVDLSVKFNPTAPGQGSGTITIVTDDPVKGTITVPVTATVLYPEMTVGPVNGQVAPTVVGCTRSQTVNVKNTGTADLIFKPTITGLGYSIAPYSGNSDGTITLAPTASVNVTVNFSPTAVSRKFAGTLTLTGNDPINPTKTVNLCGEGVRAGMRVLIVKADGTPYASVDQMTLTQVPKTTNVWKKLSLINVTPPTSCQLIQYHLEQTLPATNASGTSPGAAYNLNVRVGNVSKTVTFTLSPCDYKVIVMTVP